MAWIGPWNIPSSVFPFPDETDGHKFLAQMIRNLEYQDLFPDVVNHDVKLKVSMFEDYSNTIHTRKRCKRDSGDYCWASLGKHLASSSRNLEKLHVAHNVDVKDIFQAFYANHQYPSDRESLEWPNLNTCLSPPTNSTYYSPHSSLPNLPDREVRPTLQLFLALGYFVIYFNHGNEAIYPS
jgi:hypothetical protein